jgi:DNA-binding MarR family transcriptional regulator
MARATAEGDAGAPAARGAGDIVLTDGVLALGDWLPFEFSYTTNRVSAALARVYADRFGVSVAGWRVIAVLAEEAPCAAGSVAARLGTTPVAVTRAVAELLAKKLVSRRVDARDRRRVELRLTDAGRRVYRTVVPHARRIETELLAGLAPAEVETLRQLMAQVMKRAAALDPDARRAEGGAVRVRRAAVRA